jgi:hypothetical protein
MGLSNSIDQATRIHPQKQQRECSGGSDGRTARTSFESQTGRGMDAQRKTSVGQGISMLSAESGVLKLRRAELRLDAGDVRLQALEH